MKNTAVDLSGATNPESTNQRTCLPEADPDKVQSSKFSNPEPVCRRQINESRINELTGMLIFAPSNHQKKMNTVFDCSLVELPKIKNRAGNITVIDHGENPIPFEVERLETFV